MEIEITSFFQTATPCELSGSVAELGERAGAITWQASLNAAQESPLLDTEEKLDAMRAFARSSGGWNDEEVAAWSAVEVNALFLQWIAGDMREMGINEGVEFDAIDWEDIEARQHAGQIPSNIGRGEDGRVYFYLGE